MSATLWPSASLSAFLFRSRPAAHEESPPEAVGFGARGGAPARLPDKARSAGLTSDRRERAEMLSIRKDYDRFRLYPHRVVERGR
ncbi:hypothetical protein AVDCRST_MAG82-2632 [uncultured Rubrobacteraceae bacterium]|uniref:Uncharacterized protein n=1 Tax=uncultured Rubrobacteraceae bacterium TaxID=349277 RepID=A0A6J4QEY1_9ACTN|nr:hypothetical protein AVDCRST_MAG82-2632 [uncultured Rubrobacteraceae bacterium]